MVSIIFRTFICGKTKNMRAEEQLKLAYMTIAELKDQNARLTDAVAALERSLPNLTVVTGEWLRSSIRG